MRTKVQTSCTLSCFSLSAVFEVKTTQSAVALSLTSCFLFPAAEEGEYFLKVLIPSYAAGSIIGKGGQTIVQLQKETGATIKLSKSKDFYPGKTPTPARLLLLLHMVKSEGKLHP